jgi:hypothetical protein
MEDLPFEAMYGDIFLVDSEKEVISSSGNARAPG